MANPTLETTAPYTGMTVNQMLEAVLRRRGLTLDSTATARVLATAAEQADVLLYLKRAHTLFNSEYPETFALERLSGTWIADDNAVMLPSAAQQVLSVYLNGRFVYPMEMEDLRRGTKFDEDVTDNMGFAFTQATTLFWRLEGVADADAVANGGAGAGPQDFRPVLRIYGADDHPLSAEPYVIDYIRFGADFAADGVPRCPPVVQEWVILRGAEIWASEENDEVASALAKAERSEIMTAVWAAFDSRGDTAQRARWKYPNALADRTRRSTS